MAHLAGPPDSPEAKHAAAKAVQAAAHVSAANAARGNTSTGGSDPHAAGSSSPLVFCPIWKDPWMAVGGTTYAHDLLEICGARNAFGTHPIGRYPKITDAEIHAAAPEVILLP